MQSKEILNKLQEIGFREYESKIFLVLLKGSVLSASEIADKADIRRTAVYEILKSFTARGFCNEIETNTILKYEMIDPKVIADKIEKEISQNSKTRLEKLKSTFNDFNTLYKSDVSSETNNVNIELIRGFNKHRQTKFIELFKNAKTEILFMIRLEGFVSDELDLNAREFFKRGGIIKSIYESTLNFKIIKNNSRQNATFEDLIRICRKFEKSGEQVRLSKSELPNMTIFDRETVFTNIQDKSLPRHSNADVIIKNKDYANRMIDLFGYYWNNSFTLDEIKTTDDTKVRKGVKRKSKQKTLNS
ncbi:MAG: hypothetical protein KDD00_15615 [Ignavibacteriae bacterium]|nr:hypothetical protein [Ignavibacteriota bacterium]